MRWRNGRQLATAKTGTKTTKYEYNADGLRTRKTNADGTYADYYWVGSTLLAEVQYKANGAFTRTLMFLHDEKGAIVGVGVKNARDARFTHYYYAKNLQGDVVAIYRSDYNSTSQTYYPTLVASYEYDPWGKVIAVKGSAGTELSLSAYPNHIAYVNPIRYRGYYYDNETGFYYLQSRYYDPAISRFINADSYGSTGQGFLGTNMFAYCANNPNSRNDPNGKLWGELWDALKTAVTEVKDAFNSMIPVFSSALGLGYLDGALPYADLLGIAVIGIGAVGLLIYGLEVAAYEIVQSVQTQKAIYEQEKIQKKVHKQQVYSYWEAYRVKGTVVIGRGLTFSEAILRVASGFDIMCANEAAAKTLLFVCGYWNAVGPETHGGDGYYSHYHPHRHTHTHIWYL